MTPLRLIRVIHTAIWAVMVSLIFYIGFAGVTNTIDEWTWVAIGIVGIESLVVILNGWKCPLTQLAARHAEPSTPNFDIYLPRWLARYNQLIFGSLFGLTLILIMWRLLSEE